MLTMRKGAESEFQEVDLLIQFVAGDSGNFTLKSIPRSIKAKNLQIMRHTFSIHMAGDVRWKIG